MITPDLTDQCMEAERLACYDGLFPVSFAVSRCVAANSQVPSSSAKVFQMLGRSGLGNRANSRKSSAPTQAGITYKLHALLIAKAKAKEMQAGVYIEISVVENYQLMA